MFIAALFTIAKIWNQPKYSTTTERIKKMWYMHNMEYFLAIKKNMIKGHYLHYVKRIMKSISNCVRQEGRGIRSNKRVNMTKVHYMHV
jgi:hypothetical protein